ncbi:MAG: hypothetical protein ACKVQS_06065 [Fimbriimonadaceae bacterium]
MSAAPYITVREQVKESRVSRPSKSQPAVKRKLRVTEDVRVSAKRKSQFGLSTMEFALTQCVSFALVAVATFMFSVLIGNSMGEFERRKAVDASVMVKAAQSDILRLRQQFDRMNSSTDVGDWAVARGFVPAYGQGAEGNVNPN